MVFFTYILSISLHEPPLELSSPLRLLVSGGRPSIQASIPTAAPFPTLPFILTFTNNMLCLQTSEQWRPFLKDLYTLTSNNPYNSHRSEQHCNLKLGWDSIRTSCRFKETQSRLGVAANDGARGHWIFMRIKSWINLFFWSKRIQSYCVVTYIFITRMMLFGLATNIFEKQTNKTNKQKNCNFRKN